MGSKSAFIVRALATLLFLGVVQPTLSESPANKLLLIMVDGVRWDYFEKFSDAELPGFTKLRQNGVKAEALIPVFPSLSLVNYYSIMTGNVVLFYLIYIGIGLVAWHSGRTSVSGRRTFPVLRSTCS